MDLNELYKEIEKAEVDLNARWRPYCMMCNRSDRMVSEPYGFKCPQCGNMIGFNLKRLKESPLNNASKEVI